MNGRVIASLTLALLAGCSSTPASTTDAAVIDPTQLDYFTRIGADLSPDVRVILTWPTPAWATGHRHGEAQVALDRFVIDLSLIHISEPTRPY